MEAYMVAPIVSFGLLTATPSMAKLRFQDVLSSEIDPSAICLPDVSFALMGCTTRVFPSRIIVLLVVLSRVGSNTKVSSFPTSVASASAAVGSKLSVMMSAISRLNSLFGVHRVSSACLFMRFPPYVFTYCDLHCGARRVPCGDEGGLPHHCVLTSFYS